MDFQRSAGILLHPTSLPTDFGIGDLGPKAFAFVDFLERSGFSHWQILPLGPPGYGDSPYQSFSAFAGSHRLISLEVLANMGLLGKSDLAEARRFQAGTVDFGMVDAAKNPMLRRAFKRFVEVYGTSSEVWLKFEDFKASQAHWLEPFCGFMALKACNGGSHWTEWRSIEANDPVDPRHAELEAGRDLERFTQFVFFEQWKDLRRYANSKGIRIIGDVPIFVAHDSADVWSTPSDYKLRPDGSATVVAGVPPDFFSQTGQLWGNPIYDWSRMRDDGFKWWVARIRHALEMYDVVRIDHFRGFAACYEIPGSAITAESGEWVAVPGNDLFATLKWVFGDLPFIAEDLGFITDDVRELRDRFGFPGMRILQYGLGGDASNENLPHNYPRHCVAYSGTHDNQTLRGWYEDLRRRASQDENASRQLRFCEDYLSSAERSFVDGAVKALLASPAELVVVPMQDILGLDDESRMNTPGTVGGNWDWVLDESALSDDVSDNLRRLAEVFGRLAR